MSTSLSNDIAKSRKNRKIAVKWAKATIKPDTSFLYSDKFWSPFETEKQMRAALNKLQSHGIYAFYGEGEGAFLVHKGNPKLKLVQTQEGYGASYTSVVDGESYVTLLMGYAAPKIDEKS